MKQEKKISSMFDFSRGVLSGKRKICYRIEKYSIGCKYDCNMRFTNSSKNVDDKHTDGPLITLGNTNTMCSTSCYFNPVTHYELRTIKKCKTTTNCSTVFSTKLLKPFAFNMFHPLTVIPTNEMKTVKSTPAHKKDDT